MNNAMNSEANSERGGQVGEDGATSDTAAPLSTVTTPTVTTPTVTTPTVTTPTGRPPARGGAR